MKRFFVVISFLALTAAAQDTTPIPSSAAAIAAKQSADERYERMAADIQALQAANDALQSKLTAIQQQLQDLRNQQSQSAANSSTPQDLTRLAEKIQEVDKKREEDKQTIAEDIRKSIDELKRALAGTPGSAPRSVPRQTVIQDAAATENAFVYTVREGDSLSAIVHAYNVEFKAKGRKTISLKQAMDANSSVDWNRLRVGQKINIPQPPPNP